MNDILDTSETVNVVCLKWGDKYPAEYVNRLYRMVVSNIDIEFKFFCITDDAEGIDPRIQVKPLLFEEDLTGWWYKLQLFKLGNYGMNGQILFLDLDTVIVGNIDALFEFAQNDFAIIKDLQVGKVYNSSVFCFRSGTQEHIWFDFLANKCQIMATMHGDQDWISESVITEKLWPSDWIVSYKKQCQARDKYSGGSVGRWFRSKGLFLPKGEAIIPFGAKIVYFHGKPDPHDVVESSYGMWKKASWIKRAWGNKS